MPNVDSTQLVGRRAVLSSTIAGVAASLPIGAVSASGIESAYRTVIDIVEEGADNEGNESITPLLRELRGNDTLIKFPKGRYYMDSQLRFTNFSNFGLVGYDATLIPANYHDFDGPQYRLFRLGTAANPGRDLQFEGFRVDQTAPDTGIRVLNAEVRDGLNVQDVYINGVHDSGTWGPGLFNILDTDGTGVVRRFRAADGGLHVDDTPNGGNMWRGPTGILSNHHNRGTLTFEGCVLGAFPGNGLYATGGRGEVNIERGWYQNSATASIRLGARRGRIRGAVVRVNREPGWDTRQHAIRLDHGSWITVEDVSFRMPRPNGYAVRVKNDVDGAYIRDSDISVGPRVNTAIRIDADAGPTYLKNLDMTHDGGGNAIRILGNDAGRVGVQDVSIRGEASGSPMRFAIYCERDSCRFRHINIEQLGDSRRRGLELNGRDYMVYNCDVRSTNYPIVINGDQAWVEDCYTTAADGSASISLSSVAGSDIVLKNNRFPDGVRDSR